MIIPEHKNKVLRKKAVGIFAATTLFRDVTASHFNAFIQFITDRVEWHTVCYSYRI